MDADGEPLRPDKRQRLADPVDEADHISAALAKIANHISSSSKFSKASQLLRQLIDAVDKPHRNEYFAALQAAFKQPDQCIDPMLRKDYVRLMRTVNAKSDMLSKQQRAELEVYSIWALLRNELFTDDSFAYNKVIAKIKAAIADLPDADEEQEAAWQQLQQQQQQPAGPQQPAVVTEPADPGAAAAAAAASAAPDTDAAAAAAGPSTATPISPAGAEATAATAAAAAAVDESDPFGLNEMIERETAAAAAATAHEEQQQQAPGAGAGQAAAAAAVAGGSAVPGDIACGSKPSVGVPWDSASLAVMRKQALLDCLLAAKVHQHKLAWARTSVELLIEEVARPASQGGFADKFVGSQKQQLHELLRFVNAERAARKSGVNRRPGGKGTGDYMTSFEKARADWGAASWVSTRGKVGSQGDAKSQNWLG